MTSPLPIAPHSFDTAQHTVNSTAALTCTFAYFRIGFRYNTLESSISVEPTSRGSACAMKAENYVGADSTRLPKLESVHVLKN